MEEDRSLVLSQTVSQFMYNDRLFRMSKKKAVFISNNAAIDNYLKQYGSLQSVKVDSSIDTDYAKTEEWLNEVDVSDVAMPSIKLNDSLKADKMIPQSTDGERKKLHDMASFKSKTSERTPLLMSSDEINAQLQKDQIKKSHKRGHICFGVFVLLYVIYLMFGSITFQSLEIDEELKMRTGFRDVRQIFLQKYPSILGSVSFVYIFFISL